MIKLLIFYLFFNLSFSQTIIGEGMVGQELLNYVVDNYKTSNTLGYSNARDVLYGTIDLQENDQLSCVYSGFTITLDVTEDPSTNAYNQGVNCEHSWPQSMGADEEPQKSDLHHLYPCKANVNSSRGNHPYAEIIDQETDTWYRNDYSQTSVPTEYIDEYSEKLNGESPAFEPREDHKGNASRAMFYFYAMYQEDADTTFWNMQKNTLFDWHYLDPVDQEEEDRTWLIASYQEEQPNPFIIDTSLARRIWFSGNSSGGNPPESFSLLYPSNEMVVSSLYPEFVWHASNDIDFMDTIHYQLIVDTPYPGILTYDPGYDTSFTITEPLPDNSHIYWKIIAEDLDGLQTINQNGYQVFHTNIENEVPSTFSLVAPNYGSIQSVLTPDFYWTQSIDPDPMDEVSYVIHYEINNSGIWNNIEIFSNWYQPELNLMDNSRFKWFVQAMDLYGAESFTDSSIFFTDEFPEPPSNFSTILPLDQASIANSEIQFVWNRALDPDPLDILYYQVVYVTNLEDWQDTLHYQYSEIIEEDTTITLSLDSDIIYYWGIVARDTDGFLVQSNEGVPNELLIGSLNTKENNIPSQFYLYQNYPNPFNPITRINYDIPKDGYVSISIFDITGRKIVSLVNENKIRGSHSIYWEGKNDMGENLPGGMYIYTIKAGNFVGSKKLVLIK